VNRSLLRQIPTTYLGSVDLFMSAGKADILGFDTFDCFVPLLRCVFVVIGVDVVASGSACSGPWEPGGVYSSAGGAIFF